MYLGKVMYRQFFGLTSLPFKTTPELNMFFKDGSRAQILEALVYTVSRGDGIVKVTGEVGSGKTMLLRLLATKLPKSTEIIYINSPNLSSKDILLYICSELQIDVSNFKEKFSLTNALKNKLVDLHAKGHKVVMLIDEAQVMTFDALEEIRLLSNLETSDDKLLQMVLFGQPELDVAMENEKVRQIKSRISYSIYVPSLTPVEVHSYLNYRMRQAGYKGLDVFSVKVAKKIHKLSDGLPRNINVIADKLLMACFGLESKSVELSHFKNLPDYSQSHWHQNKFIISVFSLFVVSIILGILYYFYNDKYNSKESSQLMSSESVVTEIDENINVEQASVSQSLTKPDLPNINDNVLNKTFSSSDKDLQAKEDNATESLEKKLQSMSSDGSIIASEVNIESQTAQNKIDTEVASELKEEKAITLKLEVIERLKNTKPPKPFGLMNESGTLAPLLIEHKKSRKWLLSQQARYTIQLSTRNIASLEQTYRFYERANFDLDKLYILIDFNPRVNVYRIKAFYSLSDSFSELNRELNNLPNSVLKEGPYIVRLETLKTKLQRTEIKLKKVGIINE